MPFGCVDDEFAGVASDAGVFRRGAQGGILDPLEIVSVPLDALGPCVASLAAEGEAMVAALYEVLSRA